MYHASMVCLVLIFWPTRINTECRVPVCYNASRLPQRQLTSVLQLQPRRNRREFEFNLNNLPREWPQKYWRRIRDPQFWGCSKRKFPQRCRNAAGTLLHRGSCFSRKGAAVIFPRPVIATGGRSPADDFAGWQVFLWARQKQGRGGFRGR
jgi:hypothetical protein